MARSRSRKHARALDTGLEKGIATCLFGVGALLLPWLVGKSPMFGPLATALQPLGWVALAVGIALLVAHAFARKQLALKTPPLLAPHSPRSAHAALAPAPAPPHGASDVRDPLTSTPHALRHPAPSQREPSTEWNAGVFTAIEWRRFEAVCEALFAQAGFETRSQSHGADGGVDIWLHSRHSDGPVAVVQCKHWNGKAVGVREMREFYGVMVAHKLERGTYATTSTYTQDAAQFAKHNGINALDGAGLLALIAKRTPAQQQALLEVAFEGDYWRPTCASCGTKMVERNPSKGGAHFWGCSHYPRCKRTLKKLS